MKRAIRFCLLGVLTILVGCGPDDPTEFETGGERTGYLISDATHSNGTPGFYFLPPTVAYPPPRVTGVFDPSANAVVRVCRGTGSCSSATALAEFTKRSGTGGGPLARIFAATPLRAYTAVWDTRKCAAGRCSLTPGGAYRLHVYTINSAQVESELGYADLQVVRLKPRPRLDTANYSPLVIDLPYIIAFRIAKPSDSCANLVCSSNNIAHPTCSSGVCNGTCNDGFADCNGNKLTDGCEVDLRTDAANCGACGATCTSGTSCVAGACVASCPGGNCSTTTQACAYDNQCPGGETCAWTQSVARFLDNGNGTVTDRRTCLMWEKKTGDPGTAAVCPGGATCSNPHDVNNTYTWSTGAPWSFNGSAATDFMERLNAPPGFAGHADWRLPTSAGRADTTCGATCLTGSDPELESILTASYPNCGSSPCIDPAFGPTAAEYYWSASTYALGPQGAWFVWFDNGKVGVDGKYTKHFVRAVRGGP